MTRLVLIRHFPTIWNEQKRLQGRADIALSKAGIKKGTQVKTPAGLREANWLSSPLQRARSTAAFLTDKTVQIDDRLIEMDWGEWEGQKLSDLRARLGEDLSLNEAKGIDFRPTRGESPRDVGIRLKPLFSDIAAKGNDWVAVTHKGVIRAALALALNWDMKSKLKDGPDVGKPIEFRLNDFGTLDNQVQNLEWDTP